MKNLENIREEINQIDDQIVRLFVERLSLMQEVAAAKKTAGGQVYDPKREEEVLARLKALAPKRYEKQIETLYERIFSCCKEVQSVFFDGEDGK